MLKYDCFASHITAFSTERDENFGGKSCSFTEPESPYGGFNINPYCGDEVAHVSACRQELCAALGISDEKLILPHQIHDVVVANIDKGDAVEGADVLMTAQREVCIGVSTADCIPILLHDTRHEAICAVHSGWRGTVKHITAVALNAMAQAFKTKREDVVAAIGPGIRLEAFEVGNEVYNAFRDAGFAMNENACKYGEKWHIDLIRVVKSDLVGVKHIHDCGICTFSNPHRFFSARRLGVKSGRIFSGIMLKKIICFSSNYKRIMDNAKDIEALIISMADERQAAILRRFFKTGKGQYGEGDKFLGVKNPQVRSVVKEAWKHTTLDEAEKLARSPWHEVRLCGLLIMVAKFERAAKNIQADCSKMNICKESKSAKEAISEEEMHRIFETYLSLHPFINNWDLVDLSVYKIAGRYELMHPEITILDEWIRPEYTLWQRRISMVGTWIHIRHHQFDKAFARAENLLDSKHNLLHKAAGWMLREIYKHGGRDELEDFLEAHVLQMPSIMLSYTTELMSPQLREYWRQRRKG